MSRMIGVALSVMTCGMAAAQTSYPMLMAIKPVAAQAGKTSEHEISSRYPLDGAYAVFVSGTGVTGEVVPPAKPAKDQTQIQVRFTVAPNAILGVRDVRIASPQGVSTLGQLVIAADPVIAEKGQNDTPATAQKIELPATICGVIEKAEDLDYYEFAARAGQSLSFHVRSARLQDKLHDFQIHSDPVLTLKNSAGVDLALVDNHFAADPFLHHCFTQDGRYLLEIRDVRYQGNTFWHYSIEVHDRPFVTNTYPMQAPPGRTTSVELVGYNLPQGATGTVTMPPDSQDDESLLAPMPDAGGTPVPVIASSLPPVHEKEGENATPQTAQSISIPCGINGRIESESDIDFFAFEARRGDRFTFEVMARRFQSSLDSVLEIVDEQGARRGENDDLTAGRHVYADSAIENWTAPADGKYFLAIRDLQLRGGPGFVYFLEATRAAPHFLLQADTDKTLVAPGTHAVIYVRAVRKNGFSGPIDLGIAGLPPGVTAACGRILADAADGCMLLLASDGAQVAAANVTISGTGTHIDSGKEQKLQAVAESLQETYMPGGGRGHFPVGMHTVCVTKPLDIQGIRISPTEITLKPGESKKIEVSIDRAKDFKANVTLDLAYRHLGSVYGDSLPRGLVIDPKSKTLLTGSATQGQIVLSASDKVTPAQRQLVPVMAHVAINFVMKMTYCTPLWITVEAAPSGAEKK